MDKNLTRFSVVCNSGAKEVGLIQGLKRKIPTIGTIIVASVKSINKFSKIKRGTVVKALVVHTRKPFLRKDGTWISFNCNSVVILDNKLNPIGTRIKSPVTFEIKENGHSQVVSISEGLV